jgi:hypothetical protein
VVCKHDQVAEPEVRRGEDRLRQADAQRAGRGIHAGHLHVRMPLQGAAHLAERHHRLLGDETCLVQRGVQHWSGVPLGEHKAIPIQPVGTHRVNPHLGEVQRGHDFHC